MAEMTIVIQAVDKATAEIAKVKASVAGLSSAAVASAAATKKGSAETSAAVSAMSASVVRNTTAMKSSFGSADMAAASMLKKFIGPTAVIGGIMAISKGADGLRESFAGLATLADGLAVSFNNLFGGDMSRRNFDLEKNMRALGTEIQRLGAEAMRDSTTPERAAAMGAVIEKLSAQWEVMNAAAMAGVDISSMQAVEEELQKTEEAAAKAAEATKKLNAERAAETTALAAKAEKELQEQLALSQETMAGMLKDAERLPATYNEIKAAMFELSAAAEAMRADIALGAGTDADTSRQQLALDALTSKTKEYERALYALGIQNTLASMGFKEAARVVGDEFMQALLDSEAAADAARLSLEEIDDLLFRLFGSSEHVADAVEAQLVPALERIKPSADNARISVRELVEEADRATEHMADMFAGHSTDAFMGFIQGTKSAGAAFRDMITGMIADLLRMQMQSAFRSLFMGLLGSAAGAGAAGGSGVVGGTGSGSMAPPLPPVSGPSVLQFQHGGTVNAGQDVIVGERGPELFRPHQSGYVNNNANTMGGGGTTVNFVISAVDGPSVAAMLRREKDTIKAVVASAMATDTRFRASLN